MPVTAVVGAQWGDEGKGKIVDLLARDADIVARFGGGSNAGHTIVNEFGAFKLHSLPSGAFNPSALNIVGTGTVVDFDSLSFEIEHVLASGISNVQLAVSDRAHVVMPYHKVLDRTREQRRGEMRVGTTGQGIGPAYVDKV
ncbi:MAG TPA: adenylosuccinate synthetase, partial [Chloroflexota bacterium]|nr:adenylosuccinate synthetase [Chloroflexota bacterium]